MSDKSTSQSPSPSAHGYSLGRRQLLKGAAGITGAGLILPTVLAACGGDDDDAGSAPAETSDSDGTSAPDATAAPSAAAGSWGATGAVSIGSNLSDPATEAGLAAAVAVLPNADVEASINTTDHNTYQENISTYLQNPDDVISWFAGFRMRAFADTGLLGDITDVWDAGLTDLLSDGFKIASTGNDGKQYFVPWNYYIWGVYYKPSVFEENGWTAPADLDEFKSLASNMQDAGLTPFAFANDGNWPAMGTFDQINFRLNGYQFHVDLMAGNESWTDERVKNVFTLWAELLPFHQENPNGRKWEDAAKGIVDGTSGMMTIGTFLGSQFPDGDTSDLDFFTFPELNPEHGTGTVEAPIDGWLMASGPGNEDAAKEMLYHFGTAAAQAAYLVEDPSVVAASTDVDTSAYTPLQTKTLEAVSTAPSVTQFLDRDTIPEFAANVAGPRLADFLSDPTQIDSILSDMQEQAEVIFAG